MYYILHIIIKVEIMSTYLFALNTHNHLDLFLIYRLLIDVLDLKRKKYGYKYSFSYV